MAGVVVLIGAALTHGQLTTYGTQRKIYQRWNAQGDSSWYDTVFVDEYQGGVRLDEVSIDAKPRGSYLEITEDAWISPSATYSATVTRYWLQGKLYVPANSTIKSMYVADGTGEYVGKIMPLSPQDYPQDTGGGGAILSMEWFGTSGAGYYGSPTVDLYRFTLNGVTPGEEYHLVLTYLVPNTVGGSPVFTFNIVFEGSSGYPGTVALTNSADTTERHYKLTAGELTFQLTHGQSIQLPYRSRFTLTAIDSTASAFHMTSFDDADWKGKYLMLNTSIPDSVMANLSKPLETVVLWRWNRPSSFVFKHLPRYEGDRQYSYITGYGRQAVTQAAAIRSLINELTAARRPAGMVHSIQHRKPVSFPLCLRNTSEYGRLDTYLAQYTVDYFLTSGLFETDIAPDTTELGTPDTVDSSWAEKLDHAAFSVTGGGWQRYRPCRRFGLHGKRFPDVVRAVGTPAVRFDKRSRRRWHGVSFRRDTGRLRCLHRGRRRGGRQLSFRALDDDRWGSNHCGFHQ